MPRNHLLIDLRVNVLGWTQRRLAREVGASLRTVRGWESGTTTRPQHALLAELMKVTGVETAAELGFGPSPWCRPRGTVRPGGTGQKGPGDVLRRRDLLMIVSGAMGGAIAEPVARLFPAPANHAHFGAGDVAEVKQIRLRSHEFERMMGGGAINGSAMVRRFRTALGALHGTYRDESVRRDMHAEVAHLGTTAGWILVDQGEHATAQRMFAAALAAADGAPTDKKVPLRTLVLAAMSRQAIYLNDHRTAVELLDYLEPALTELPACTRAVVRSRRARALGGLGDVHAVTKLTDRASDEAASASTNDAVAEIADIGLGGLEFASDIGHAFGSLAVDHGIRSEEAARRLTSSIAAYGSDDARSRSLAGIRLVNVHLAQRDGQRALKVATTHAAEATLVRSTQIHEHAETGLRLAARHRTDPAISDVVDILRTIRRPIPA